MLSRGNSNASTRLRKAKSSSSFKKPKSILIDLQDPAVARQQALDAAIQAYERAHGPGLSSKDVNSRTPESRHRNSDNTGLSAQLGRRQSVRFAGPSAIPIRQRSITRRETPEYRKSQEFSQSHLKRKESSLNPIETLVTGLPDCGESALVGGGSVPSSYRKLRKAKSMFYPRKSPSVVFAKPQTKFDIRPYLLRPSSEVTDSQTQPMECGVLESPALPTGRTSLATRPSVSQERTVQEARDYYIRELEQQRLKEKPSLGILGMHPKSQKPFRRTVRTSSINSYGNAIASPKPPSIEAKRYKTLGHKARILSMSLKDKLKNLFHRHQESQEVIPVQRLDAIRAHYGGYESPNSGVNQRYSQIPSPDDASLQRSQSRDFVLRSAPLYLGNNSQPGSIRSVRSEDSVNNAKSRVTSWTNSTAADTLKSKLMEQKRLSIIQENGGPHQPSSSAHRYDGLYDGYAVFRKPAQRANSGGRATGPLDSQRVFSALQKRFNENERLARQEEVDTNATSSVSQRHLPGLAITPRASSSLSRNNGSSKAQPLEGRPSLLLDSPLNVHANNFSKSMKYSFSNATSPKGSPDAQRSYANGDENHGTKNVDSFHKRDLQEVSNALFPQDVHLENRRASSLWRAKHASAEFEGAIDEDSFAIIRTRDNRRSMSRSTVRGHRPGSTVGSGSIYSRTMSDQKDKLSHSSVSLPLSESSGEPDIAVIATKKSSNPPQSCSPNIPGNFPSARSSYEWKQWMASQVSQIEHEISENSSFCNSGPAHETGHRRENAQIHNDDVEIAKRTLIKITPKQPLAATSGNAMRFANRQVPSDTMVERFPLLEIGPPPSINGKEQYTSSLYSRSDTSLTRKSPNTDTEKISSLKGARSFNVLRTKQLQVTSIPQRSSSSYRGDFSVDGSTDLSQIIGSYETFAENERTPTKATTASKRHSPKRAARLRRKQSNISAASKGTENSRPTPMQSKDLSHQHENQIISDEKSPEMEVLFPKIDGVTGVGLGGDGIGMGSKNMDPAKLPFRGFRPQTVIRNYEEILSFLLLTYIPTLTLAIFADEAYRTDYLHALLGVPQPHSTFFYQPSAASKASLLYTLSERGVLGAVNPRDGTIVWRQQLKPPSQSGHNRARAGFLKAIEGDNIVVSAVNGLIQAWDAGDGRLTWEWKGSGTVESLEIGNTEDSLRDVLFLSREESGQGVVRKLASGSGKVIWEYQDESGDLPAGLSSSATGLHYISIHSNLLKGTTIKVAALNSANGVLSGQTALSSDNEATSEDPIDVIGTNSAVPIISWTDKSMKVLKINPIGTKHVISLHFVDLGDHVQNIYIHVPKNWKAPPHFLVHYQLEKSHFAEVYHLDVSAGTAKKTASLPLVGGHGAFSTSLVSDKLIFARHTSSEVTLVSSDDGNVLGAWSIPPESQGGLAGSGVSHAASEVVSRGDSSYAVRSALTLPSGDWALVRNSDPVWMRAESLAGVVAAAWAQVVEEEGLAQELAIESHGSVVRAYIHRVKRHVRDLQNFPAWLKGLEKRMTNSLFGNPEDASNSPTNNGFGYRKLIVVATDRGRLMGLDAGSQGSIIWSIQAIDLQIGQTWEVFGIEVADGIATVRGSGGEILRVRATTGDILQHQPGNLIPGLKTLIPFVATTGEETRIPLNDDGSLGDLPVGMLEAGTTVVTRLYKGSLRGWSHGKGGKPQLAWEFQPKPGEIVTGVSYRPAHDPVASIGKVLGDRNVMYKYLNTNLLLIITVGLSASTATIYLLDSISGEILYTTIHSDVDTSYPITSTFSENWFAYSLLSQPPTTDFSNATTFQIAPKAYQLVVSELYESEHPNDRGSLGAASNFSSIYPVASDEGGLINVPHVISQAWIIPGPISHMAVTSSLQGITPRSLLCILPSINALIAIPRHVIDPSRPVGRDPSSAEMEEGLFKYTPVIEFEPKWIISHKREVMGIRNVITSPTLLESTSLVFAFGDVDVFGTRVMPIGGFDILGKGFNKWQLIGTVVALGIGTGFLAPLVRKKQIDGFWKA